MAQTTIQGSFLGDATVTGAKIGADFISAQTALTTGLATTDEIIVSDAGVIKRMDISVIEIAATQITASGTLPALVGTALTALNASNLGSGTVPVARLGDGNESNSTFLRGDNTWVAVSGTTINNNADNRIITGSGTANTLEGETTLTFDNAALAFSRNHAGNNAINLVNDENNASASTRLTIQTGHANAGDAVALFHAGGDSYIIGVDNSDSNKFKIAATGSNLGTNDVLTMATSGGDVTVSTGNLVIGTAGKGIDFSAHGHTSATGSSMDSELLDAYEEGTWTPVLLDDTLNGSGTDESQTYSVQSGYYTRIGNWVHFIGWLTVTSKGSLTNGAAANIGGLPFASSSQSSAQSATVVFGDGGGFALGTAGYSITGCVPVGGHDHFYMKLWDSSSGVSTLSIAEFDTPDCIFSGNYRL